MDTGRINDETGRCGMMDGTITEVIDSHEIPSTNGQADSEAVGWQSGSEENTIEVPIGDEWHIFAAEEQQAG